MQKKIHCRVIGLFIGLAMFSVTCLGQTPATPPAAYNGGIKINYARTCDAIAPEQSPGNLVTRPVRDVIQTTAYLDGLGRPLETVVKQGSLETSTGANVDLIFARAYDANGRETYKYLPFASTATDATKNNGLFKFDPFQQQVSFYNSQLANQPSEINIGAGSLNWAYNKINSEASPLGRVQSAYAPGVSWAGSESNVNPLLRRGAQQDFLANTTTDDVKIWTVTDVTNNWGTYAMTGAYSSNQLYKRITTDEHGKQVIEFTDKEGRLILKKVQLTATADNGTGSGYPGWLCTYYVYDNFSNIRLVIQPKGVELLIANSWNITALGGDILNEQCFRYEFDQRYRMIRKKVPGAGEELMVYDQWDRLVLMQDANLRTQNKWLFTKYGFYDRPVMTGTYINSTYTTQSTMQAFLQLQNMAKGESYTPGGSLPMYSMNQSFPVVTYNDVLTVTYYDDYEWANNVPSPFRTFENGYNSYFNSPNNNYPYPQSLTPSFNTKGLVTGTIKKALDGSTAMVTTAFYDDFSRVIQTKAENYKGGCDITTIQYSYNGNVLKTMLRHQNPVSNYVTSYVFTDYNYDDLWRISSIKKNVSATIGVTNTGTGDKFITTNEYDKLGQLKKKILGSGIETLNFDYNIRGWLLGANRDFIKDASTNKFGFELGYDKPGTIINGANYANQQYNGNISGMTWKSFGDNQKRKYDFTYDAINRLTAADFNQCTSGSTFNKSKGIDFSVSNLSYDANGNILTMQQTGWKPGGSVLIDNLTYNYFNNSNRLKNVVDGVNDVNTKLGDFRSSQAYMTSLGGAKTSSAIDYTYDDNGNLVKDLNKDINNGSSNAIVYNHLNLPTTINFGAGKSISYVYDADGNKLKKVVHESGHPDKTTIYIAGFIYEDDALQFLSHEEGRIRYTPAINSTAPHFDVDYFLKDHLGNVRMVLTEEQQQDIYPAATLEGNLNTSTDAAYIEKNYYNINAAYVVTKPGGITDYPNNNGNPPVNNNPNSNTTAISQQVYQLNSNTNKTGLGITLKVMAGDVINIFGKSYYFVNTPIPGNASSLPVLDLLNAFAGTAGMTGKGISGTDLNGNTALVNDISSLLFTQPDQTTTHPKAFINWIFFDEQFNYAGGSFDGVGTSGSVKDHNNVTIPNIPVPKNGYVFIYCSNESPLNVFFDNLQVIHTRGALLEETHYYPFGLTMAGISSKAAGKPENKFKFNDGTSLENKEFSDGSGLEWYATEFRTYDPQIGRLWQIDPLADFFENQSPYTFAFNNPILLNDPLGLKADTAMQPVIVTPRGPDPLAPRCYTCGVKPEVAGDPGTPANNPPGLAPESSPARGVPNFPTKNPTQDPINEPINEPVNDPKVRPFPWLPPAILTAIGVLIPLRAGPDSPFGDEDFFHRYPELSPAYSPRPRIVDRPPIQPHPQRLPLYFVRNGPGPESAEVLDKQSKLAAANGFPHGVSVRLISRISGTDKRVNRSALVQVVMANFIVQKTGKNAEHFTVHLPNPVTPADAALFNTIFLPKYP